MIIDNTSNGWYEIYHRCYYQLLVIPKHNSNAIDNNINNSISGNSSKNSTQLLGPNSYYCVKSVCIQSFSELCIPAFGLNTERDSVSLRIQSECGKIRARKTPITDTFYAAD